MLPAVQTGEGVFGATSYRLRFKVNFFRGLCIMADVAVFGDQKGRGVRQVETNRLFRVPD